MRWATRAGLAGLALGAVATTVAVERLTVSRSVRRQAREALDAAGPFGTLRGEPGTAFADDGTELHYEVEEAPGGAAGTVVFCHGYCLNQDVWHFQRAALRGRVRAVYWDQRGHGRSAPGRAQRERGEPLHIRQLGRDLRAVLDAAAPEGPVVLVGHSMGGMTVMSLVERHPDYVARRVAGVALLATSAGDLAQVDYGFPAPVVRAARRAAPGVLRALGSQAELVERGRRAVGDLYAGLIRRYSFGDPETVDPAVARFAERLIESVPIDVVAEFYPAFAEHATWEALTTLHTLSEDLPVLVLVGDRDEITPPEHSGRIASALPAAEFTTLPGAGHLVLLEEPEAVTARLVELLTRSIGCHGPTAD
ncbi:Lysophospholipase, alpha-beta hydrolase superfamily [Streptomyces zhaozhouensis]|uniref:Lysophospholipase, alpha-beta hydrolase superfamily n=1 Tax=Streptomyces zhaozhouensis TaxID=1300267 RepID=A0A286DTF5_9ACTN|nr:alpha/beta hydrolase [Streptomyces zhaozhouensis]SOD61930.1 Lysophospholipase, alpha-beta hydrolase superfamily [Streptomyces zhaozhouensis]